MKQGFGCLLSFDGVQHSPHVQCSPTMSSTSMSGLPFKTYCIAAVPPFHHCPTALPHRGISTDLPCFQLCLSHTHMHLPHLRLPHPPCPLIAPWTRGRYQGSPLRTPSSGGPGRLPGRDSGILLADRICRRPGPGTEHHASGVLGLRGRRQRLPCSAAAASRMTAAQRVQETNMSEVAAGCADPHSPACVSGNSDERLLQPTTV